MESGIFRTDGTLMKIYTRINHARFSRRDSNVWVNSKIGSKESGVLLSSASAQTKIRISGGSMVGWDTCPSDCNGNKIRLVLKCD